ncbi:hypothetical protein GLOTRDRAFT_92856 [Gloeophyllum trabeum ATCC 11539]|uniref:Uncharacterized protein n=1 Tax=Gloeophyllum trabeum (strain ATCC 11539 / FP-39264 / Madison 617) TaxID=670483 RepID=S7RPB8_GLOTA|nr:uncharacterized protein GLOTRDRAFT_92856 [Gloeophyllum trabeum ATCC 11539]EPQ56380.1 hypothetical protein GLOTRDRAFT_92856 [Gloeophyllum trabeum ATCC 11539]
MLSAPNTLVDVAHVPRLKDFAPLLKRPDLWSSIVISDARVLSPGLRMSMPRAILGPPSPLPSSYSTNTPFDEHSTGIIVLLRDTIARPPSPFASAVRSARGTPITSLRGPRVPGQILRPSILATPALCLSRPPSHFLANVRRVDLTASGSCKFSSHSSSDTAAQYIVPECTLLQPWVMLGTPTALSIFPPNRAPSPPYGNPILPCSPNPKRSVDGDLRTLDLTASDPLGSKDSRLHWTKSPSS